MKALATLLLGGALVGGGLSFNAAAADYIIDTKGGHASINFKIPHLGYSMLLGRFNHFSGSFSYDQAAVSDSKISVVVETSSLDSNHAERDKHLKGSDFIEVAKFPKATFESRTVTDQGEGKLQVVGDLTLHGVTKSITIDAEKIGEGKDPWGGYRVGFSGTTVLKLKDFGIPERLGPASTEVIMDLHVEGVRQ